MRNVIVLASALGVASLLGLSLTGCDGGGDGTGGGGGAGGSTGSGPTVGDACKSLAAAVCGQIDGCSPFLMQVTYGDEATCEARIAARCENAPSPEASNVTAADIDACAKVYEARTCADLFEAGPDECRIPGDKDDGAPCATAGECKGNVCYTATEGTCGTCGSFVAEGGSCANASDTCDPHLYCDANTGICTKPAASGEACSEAKLCKASLSCNSGTCGPVLGEGGDCSAGELCDFTAGLICFSNTCTKLAVSKLGEACGYDADTGALSTCVADTRCDDATMICVARPVEGEACKIEGGTGDCASGFDCIGGKCSSGLPQCQ